MSMNAGVELAIGDFIFEFDSTTIGFMPEIMMQVYFRALEGYDIVTAAPAEVRRYSSKMFYKIYNSFSDNQYKLKSESFYILSRRAINRIHSMSRTIPYRKAIYANCGLYQDTIFFELKENSGLDKIKSLDVQRFRLAVDALILFTDVGYKFAFLLSVGMIICSILIAIYVTYIFVTKQPVSGWTSMMLFLSLSGAGAFSILAIIIKYLDILIGLIFKKRIYTVESIEKIAR